MSDSVPAADPTMSAIGAAMAQGQSGDADVARAALLSLWDEIGADGDALHRCTLAHYLADLYPDAGDALIWDLRALEAADSLTDERARAHHASLQVEGFYPSLHLNLADCYRRLGRFDEATRHITLAQAKVGALPEGPYGDMIRGGIEGCAAAIDERDVESNG